MDKGTKQMYSMFLLMAGAVQAFLVYYYAYPMWAALGLRGALRIPLCCPFTALER